MKNLVLMLVILCFAGVAWADYEPTQVHVVYLNTLDLDEVVAAQFAVGNLPLAQCTITEHWNTDMVIGNVIDGLDLYFPTPLTGQLMHLGWLEFTVWEPIEDDYLFSVIPHPGSGQLIIIDGVFNTIPVDGGNHIFNCVDLYGCAGMICGGELGLWTDDTATECSQDVEVFVVPVEAGSWSTIKSLY